MLSAFTLSNIFYTSGEIILSYFLVELCFLGVVNFSSKLVVLIFSSKDYILIILSTLPVEVF
jgi:hypothetical protein